MYQDNSNKTIKANEGNGILAVSDSLAFCVSASPKTRLRPTSQEIFRYRIAKFVVQSRLWNEQRRLN